MAGMLRARVTAVVACAGVVAWAGGGGEVMGQCGVDGWNGPARTPVPIEMASHSTDGGWTWDAWVNDIVSFGASAPELTRSRTFFSGSINLWPQETICNLAFVTNGHPPLVRFSEPDFYIERMFGAGGELYAWRPWEHTLLRMAEGNWEPVVRMYWPVFLARVLSIRELADGSLLILGQSDYAETDPLAENPVPVASDCGLRLLDGVWSRFGPSGLVNGPQYNESLSWISDVATSGQGEIYAIGAFQYSDGLDRLAIYDGTSWRRPAGAERVSSEIHSVGIDSQGRICIAGLEGVYVGESFEQSVKISECFASWSGSAWVPTYGTGVGQVPWGGRQLSDARLSNGVAYFHSFGEPEGIEGTLGQWNGSGWSLQGPVDPLWTSDYGMLYFDQDGSPLRVVSKTIVAGSHRQLHVVKVREGQALIPEQLGASAGLRAIALSRPQAGQAGHVVIGGDFSIAGDRPAMRIAAALDTPSSWWSGLAQGLSDSANSMAYMPDGRLVVGGWFTSAGGLACSRVAMWDGVSWSALGAGVNGIVDAIAVGSNGEVFVGGAFSNAGGVATRGLAKWTQAGGWEALNAGGTPGTRVYSLLVQSDGTLLVGGSFSTMGGVAANGIARLSGSTWSAVGGGIDSGGVLSLERLPGGGFIAGGLFNGAGGVVSPNIVRWDGAGWRAMGAGLRDNDQELVYAVAVSAEGLVVAGSGTFADPAPSGSGINRLWLWDDDRGTWARFGQGVLGGKVSCLEFAPDGDLVIGGQFLADENSGRTWDNFARYEFDVGPATVLAESGATTVCRGRTGMLEVMASGAGPLVYQWHKVEGGVPVAISAGVNPSAATALLSLFNTQAGDAGEYRCLVSGPCGSAWSAGMVLTVNGIGCGAADIGTQGGLLSPCGDGALDNNDFVVFIDLYFQASPLADLGVQGGGLGSDGALDNNDFVAFIDLFFSGC